MSEHARSPWAVVLELVEEPADALALMSLWEYRERELLANGSSVGDVLEAFPSEREVAELLADRMRQRWGGQWSYADFYAGTRGLDATPEEIARFVARCANAGIRLHDAGEVASRS